MNKKYLVIVLVGLLILSLAFWIIRMGEKHDSNVKNAVFSSSKLFDGHKYTIFQYVWGEDSILIIVKSNNSYESVKITRSEIGDMIKEHHLYLVIADFSPIELTHQIGIYWVEENKVYYIDVTSISKEDCEKYIKGFNEGNTFSPMKFSEYFDTNGKIEFYAEL